MRAFAWASGLTLLLAVAGGAFLGSSFLRRIDTIGRTSRIIMEGGIIGYDNGTESGGAAYRFGTAPLVRA